MCFCHIQYLYSVLIYSYLIFSNLGTFFNEVVFIIFFLLILQDNISIFILVIFILCCSIYSYFELSFLYLNVYILFQ